MATAAENLATARDNMALAIKVQTANWTAAGCPPTFSIDGESYQWNDWLRSQSEGLKALQETIAVMDPFELIQQAY